MRFKSSLPILIAHRGLSAIVFRIDATQGDPAAGKRLIVCAESR